MEGIYWLRISAIAALFLGSVYVLLPTALQGDLEAELEEATSSIEGPNRRNTADLDVVFEGSEADGAVLEARLRLDGVSVDRVSSEGGLITVTLKPGANKDEVRRVASIPGARSLYSATALAPLPEEAPPPPEELDTTVVSPQVVEALNNCDPDQLTPREALDLLYQMREMTKM